MRKLLVLALWTWIPFCWQPLDGQPPAIRVGKGGVKQPDRGQSAKDNRQPDERGTKALPFVVDTEGHQNTKDEQSKADAEKQHIRDIERDTLFYARLGAWATFALVLIGLGGVCAALITLGAIQRQADLQERAIRPWIGTDFIMDGLIRPDGPGRVLISAKVQLRNTGQSIALEGLMLPFLISAVTSVFPNEIKRVWSQTETMLRAKSETGWETGFVLHPGGTHLFEVNMGTEISLQEIQAGICWVLACVIYKDQFGKSHRTQDCFRVEQRTPETVDFQAVPAQQTAN